LLESLNSAKIFSLAAIPIAIACNLHQLDSPANYSRQPYGLLPAPRSSLHANERINLWWSLWLMDKRGALTLEIPQAFPYRDAEVRLLPVTTQCSSPQSKAITTPMPVSRNAIATVEIHHFDGAQSTELQPIQVGLKYYTWKTLKSAILGDHNSMDVSADSVLGLRVKSTFILSESMRTANGLLGTPIASLSQWRILFLIQFEQGRKMFTIGWISLPLTS
jgi:hypothetical protein